MTAVFVGDEARQRCVVANVVDIEVALCTTYFTTVGDLFDAAEVVVTGRVVSVELEGGLFPDVAVGLDDMPRMAVYTVAVDEVFKGDPSQMIRTTRTSFVRYGDELRPVLLNGVPPNQVGDRMLWFLTSNSNLAEYFPVSMRGLVVILDGVITTELYENVEGVQKLKGELADDVFARLRSLAEDSWVLGCLAGQTHLRMNVQISSTGFPRDLLLQRSEGIGRGTSLRMFTTNGHSLRSAKPKFEESLVSMHTG